MNAPPQKRARIDAIDALRGFALIGVGLVHMIEQYLAAAPAPGMSEMSTTGIGDQIIAAVNFLFMTGKFYLVFSFLFGLSFFIQIDRPMQRGEPFAMRFAWRLVLLFAFGYLHHLYYRGDILMLYSVLGVLLILFVRLPTKALILIACMLFLGAGRFVSFGLFGGPSEALSPDSAESLAYYQTLKTGSMWDVMVINNFGAFKGLVDFQFGMFGRAYITFGLFLVGICIGRTRIFWNIEAHRPLIKRIMKWSLVACVLSVALMIASFSQVQQPSTLSTWTEAIGLTFFDLFNLSFATFLSCIFLLLVLGARGRPILNAFAPYGRMALTNYMLQSLIGAYVFYGWGLGLLGKLTNSDIWLISIVVVVAQIMLSRYWMSRFHYGPFEWLWRTGTLLKPIPLVKSNIVKSPA